MFLLDAELHLRALWRPGDVCRPVSVCPLPVSLSQSGQVVSVGVGLQMKLHPPSALSRKWQEFENHQNKESSRSASQSQNKICIWKLEMSWTSENLLPGTSCSSLMDLCWVCYVVTWPASSLGPPACSLTTTEPGAPMKPSGILDPPAWFWTATDPFNRSNPPSKHSRSLNLMFWSETRNQSVSVLLQLC